MVAGYVLYEAAPAFDRGLRVRRPTTIVLAALHSSGLASSVTPRRSH